MSVETPGTTRALWAVLLALGSLWLGFVGGTALAGQVLVPADSGLAGPVQALGYGLVAGLAAAICAALLSRRLPVATVRVSAITLLALTLLSFLWIAWRVLHLAGSQV